MKPDRPAATIPIKLAAPGNARGNVTKGRGTALDQAHRFERQAREALDDGWPQDDDLPANTWPTQVHEQRASSILSRNDSPDIGFETSLNPYRGCEHGCIYCYARPTHSYLDLSPGLDFETQLVAKINAAELLRQTLAKPSYRPQRLCLGTVTDAYQPIERQLRLTRGLIEVLGEHDHAFSLITKGSGVERDLDLIAPMAARGLAGVYITLTTLDPHLARVLEPRASAPHRRLQTIRRLTQAGVPVGVSVSPTIPFVNEPELEHILAAARDAGATRAFSIPLRLPWELKDLFQDWLTTHLPDRAARVMARVREMHGGRDYKSDFGTRFTGEGPWAELLRQRFTKACDRLGLGRERFEYRLDAFRRPVAAPGSGVQLGLFDS